MVSLLYKFLQACYKSVIYFASVLKIVHRSPGSHDKVIYMIFFVPPASLTKFENYRYNVWSPFCVSSVIRIEIAWQSL